MASKADVYKQIDAFNALGYDPKFSNSDPKHKKYHFVPGAIAQERGKFFKYALENTSLKDIAPDRWKAMDLAFGSGSLTSRLLLESGIPVEAVIFNDKNEVANQDISAVLDHAKVTSHDFLNSASFDPEKRNLVVFNPQTGGSYEDGASHLGSESPVLFDGSLEDYLKSIGRDTSELTFSVDDTTRKIKVHTDTLKKRGEGGLEEIIGDVKIFNYYDVFWQSKETKVEGEASNNVKLRQTFDKVFDPTGILIYYGDEAFFKALFTDFPFVVQLCSPDDGKNLFITTKAVHEDKTILYKNSGESYEETDSCKESTSVEVDYDLDELENTISDQLEDLHQASDQLTLKTKTDDPMKEDKKPFGLSSEKEGALDFSYKNILLKGVPGTGKSRLVNKLIKDQLKLSGINHPNVLRINVHSASSNADLMQGIGITTIGHQVAYHEKTGLILHHLKEAIAKPYQPFAMVLEEIQENSLNELIGDLIYLIEEGKRVDLVKELEAERIESDQDYESYEVFIDHLINHNEDLEYVELPYLVKTETRFRKLVFPANLYVFCTSNYRDDKKVVEDNLMRRFDLIELYPKYESVIEREDVAKFLQQLNDEIIKQFEGKEIHPDRFIIGHANWIKVNDVKAFYRALLKAIVEFKDIREIEWHDLKPIMDQLSGLPFGIDPELIKQTNYKDLIDELQKRAFGDLLDD